MEPPQEPSSFLSVSLHFVASCYTKQNKMKRATVPRSACLGHQNKWASIACSRSSVIEIFMAIMSKLPPLNCSFSKCSVVLSIWPSSYLVDKVGSRADPGTVEVLKKKKKNCFKEAHWSSVEDKMPLLWHGSKDNEKKHRKKKTVTAFQLPCALDVFFEVALAAAPRSESYQLQRQTSRLVLPLCIAVALSQSCKSQNFYLYPSLQTPQTALRLAGR